MLYPCNVPARLLATLTLLILAGCGPSGPRDVRNDDYEKPTEPDYALRQLLGVRTLQAEFEMPQGMKTFRVGLLYIVDGQVTASQWLSGDGLHTSHSDGSKEYAKTLYAEFMVGKSNGEWKERLHVAPSFATRIIEANADFWENYEETKLGTRGWSTHMEFEKFGEFQVLGAIYGAQDYVATGPVENLLQDMDFLALLVVDFLPEDSGAKNGRVEFPTDEELQAVIAEEIGGVR